MTPPERIDGLLRKGAIRPLQELEVVGLHVGRSNPTSNSCDLAHASFFLCWTFSFSLGVRCLAIHGPLKIGQNCVGT